MDNIQYEIASRNSDSSEYINEFSKEDTILYENCMKIAKEMLNDREYIEIDEDDNKWIYQKKYGDLVVVFFCYYSQLNINTMKEYIKYTEEKNINHCIMLYKNNITPSAKKIITSLCDIEVELFCMNELQYNITKHRYYRPHIELSKEESKEFKKKFGVKIPILLKSDPVCRYYNFDKDSIIKITRKDDYISYRIVK